MTLSSKCSVFILLTLQLYFHNVYDLFRVSEGPGPPGGGGGQLQQGGGDGAAAPGGPAVSGYAAAAAGADGLRSEGAGAHV